MPALQIYLSVLLFYCFVGLISAPPPLTDRLDGSSSNETLRATHPCRGGVTLARSSGVIRSPAASLVSTKYPTNVECLWRIRAPEGMQIRVTASRFALEASDGCAYDYVEIYDGNDDQSQALGRVCGTNFTEGGINSTNNELLIKFKSDDSVTKEGFALIFFSFGGEPIPASGSSNNGQNSNACNKRITASLGIIISPMFDVAQKYDTNSDCSWLIDAGKDKVVKLQFLEFDLEYSTNCLYDSVAVYDGSDKTATLVDRYCGSHLPENFKSSGRNVYIKFKSDSSVQRKGFKASFSTESAEPNELEYPGCSSSNRPAILESKEGILKSPSVGPKAHYPDKTVCQWRIKVSRKKRAHIHFSNFQLEPDNSYCRYDNVQIYDGEDTTAPSLGRYCGNDIPGDITSSSRYLLIEFRSDDSVTARGFSLVYSAKDESGGSVGRGINGTREPACGIPQHVPKFARIVGGTQATPYSWPWQVSLQYLGNHYCGASIISRHWILTAAHCVYKNGVTKSAKDFTVRLGEHNLKVVEGRELTRPVAQIIVHERYNEAGTVNDIALLRITREITYTVAIKPVCLPRRDAPSDLVCISTGWGETMGTGDRTKLNQVRVPIIDRNLCRRFDYYGSKYTGEMLCAGFPEGSKDSCQGDSGGPLVCRDRGVYVQQGITSWGFGCARRKSPGVYTRLTRFIDWIDDKTGGAYQAPA